VLRDALERERISLQLFIRSQSQRGSVPRAPLAPSVTGGTVPTPSNPLVQPSPSEQPSIPSEQPSILTIPPIVPVMDDVDELPPSVVREDINSDSDDEDDGNGVSANPRPAQVRTRSVINVRPPNRMSLNAMKVK
jgi:hypothetical protein